VPDDLAEQNDDLGAAEWVGQALEAALRARAPGVYASTPMVRQLAAKVGQILALDAGSAALLDTAVRVRDVGMIALPDPVVLATTPLSPADWELVNHHPVIGAELLKQLPAVAAAAEIVRAHHERWDGGGYPDGRRGEAIPLLSRVIATCDAFVAIATDRPHRRGLGAEAALAQVLQESESQFDPRIAEALVAALGQGTGPRRLASSRNTGAAAVERRSSSHNTQGSGHDLMQAIAELDVVPAFAPAHERVLELTARDPRARDDLVAAIEGDIGLTIAVLRRAQSIPSRQPIANVPDAVTALTSAEIELALRTLPRAAFPWRTSQLEVRLHRFRVHAQAVARAADRIARGSVLIERDDVLVAALLHDLGKLVLGRAFSDYTSANDKTIAPEERLRQEQLAWGIDHAGVGALLLRKWGLPEQLAAAVATHHTADADHDVSTIVRLADMIVHHAQSDTVHQSHMLRLAGRCGLSAIALRDVMFELPQAGGSRRRRAEPSPFSTRETAVLRILAQGKVYKAIAQELGVSSSTIRSHLHNVYGKLDVDNRAQAVLRATEMGWI
jgi:putative nucleotidyltransferase with HDIG domain